MAAVQITEKNFESEVVKSDLPVLIDFWAEWCGPCRAIAPVVDEISKELAGKLKVGKVNVDENQELAVKFNVMSIPTLLIFKKGEPVDSIIGAMGKDQLMEKLKKQIT